MICVGGDGSLAIAQQFHEFGIPVVGVPKTIDNDLSATAFTFGFDSAVDCATDALDRLHTTAASHERVFVLEVMGRHAGWIALHAGVAGGADVILIPEIPWTFEHVCHKILDREQHGKRFTLIVVAEGAELPEGGMVGEHREGAQAKLGGIGAIVAAEIERRLLRETRVVVLGHLQRGGAPTTFDRVLATQYGAHAVRLIAEGRLGEMICYHPPQMESVPIRQGRQSHSPGRFAAAPPCKPPAPWASRSAIDRSMRTRSRFQPMPSPSCRTKPPLPQTSSRMRNSPSRWRPPPPRKHSPNNQLTTSGQQQNRGSSFQTAGRMALDAVPPIGVEYGKINSQAKRNLPSTASMSGGSP